MATLSAEARNVAQDQPYLMRMLEGIDTLMSLTAEGAAAGVTLTEIVTRIDGILLADDQPRHGTSMLNLSYANGMLDDFIDALTALETAAHAAEAQKPKRQREPSDDQSKAVAALLLRIANKITGARRMLHLRPVETEAGVRYRGLDDEDEALLQGILPISDIGGNVSFTRMVLDNLKVHKESYSDFTAPDEKITIALMWTDPWSVILRQLFHIDAIFGQVISVTMLSKEGDALSVCNAPALTADEALRKLGFTAADIAWLKDRMPDTHTKMGECGALAFPEVCERFKVDVVAPGAYARMLGVCSRI